MSTHYYEELDVTGVANEEIDSSSFVSPENEKRQVVAVRVNVSAVEGNTIKLYVERQQIMNISDYLIGTGSVPDYQVLPLDIALPPGQKLIMALQCGGTASNLRANVVYTVT